MTDVRQWSTVVEPAVGGFVIDETGEMREVFRAFVDATAAGDTVIVAAIASKRIRIIGLILVGSAAVTIRFRSGVTPISAGFPLAANGGMAPPVTAHGWAQTAINEALNLNLSGIANVGGQVLYCLV